MSCVYWSKNAKAFHSLALKWAWEYLKEIEMLEAALADDSQLSGSWGTAALAAVPPNLNQLSSLSLIRAYLFLVSYNYYSLWSRFVS